MLRSRVIPIKKLHLSVSVRVLDFLNSGRKYRALFVVIELLAFHHFFYRCFACNLRTAPRFLGNCKGLFRTLRVTVRIIFQASDFGPHIPIILELSAPSPSE